MKYNVYNTKGDKIAGYRNAVRAMVRLVVYSGGKDLCFQIETISVNGIDHVISAHDDKGDVGVIKREET